MTARNYPEILHLGCGTDYREGEHNVDSVPEVNPDEVVDLDDPPWPWHDESFVLIRANHVFEHLTHIRAALEESQRVLRPAGRLIVRMPIGLDALADPDHKHIWTWRTPEYYCGKRHWDSDVGLTVVNRDVDLWPAGQTNPLAGLDKVQWWIRRVYEGPGPWCFNQAGSCGEFEIVFQKL